MTLTTPAGSAFRTSAVDPRQTLARMKDAQRRRGAPSYDERIDSLDRLERAVVGRSDAIAAAISRDFGSRSIHETWAAEIFIVKRAIQHAKDHLREWMEPEQREVGWVFLPSTAYVLPQPVGVVGIISPWNYPVLLALSPLVGALAAGNRAMIKPSEIAPATAALLADLIAAAFAENDVAVVTGGADVGELFSRLPFDHLLFTGSGRVGKLVMRAASENLVPVTLELGGKSPAILGSDFSVHTAAARIMAGKLFSAGQTCIAPDYAIVQDGARDSFVDSCKRSVGKMYPTIERNPDYTSIVSETHLNRLRSLLEDATARGARIVDLTPAGETLDAVRKLGPILVLDVTDDMLVMQEEIFGPILPIMTYRNLGQAIDYVNGRPRPLALYYFGHDETAIDRVLLETLSGGVTVNETLLHIMQDDLPFGGIGASGMGHYHGRAGFETLTKKKAVFRQAGIGVRGLVRAPYGRTASRLLRFLIGK